MSTADALSARQIHIVESAMRLFNRYGVRRTTMNDIAIESEVARQTLYNTFANKDDVLRAAIQLLADKTCAELQEAMASSADLEGKLARAVHHLAVVPWDLLAQSNHAEDIMEGVNGASQGAFDVAEDRYKALLATAFEPHAQALEAVGASAQDMADFVVTGAIAIKHKARDRDHLLELLSRLTQCAARLVC